jgi:uncharacterized protein YjbJ (UPF0337 family)
MAHYNSNTSGVSQLLQCRTLSIFGFYLVRIFNSCDYFLNKKEKERGSNMKSGTEDKVEGKLRQTKGKIKETLGDVTDNSNLQAEGSAEKIEGKAEEKKGEIKKVFGK